MDGSRQRRRRRRGSPPPPPAAAAAPGRPRTVPIAVTPEGFWCCPSPAALHKSLLKNPHHNHAGGGGGNKQSRAPPTHKTPYAPPSRAPSVRTAPSVTDEPEPALTDEQQQSQSTAEAPAPAPAPAGGQQEPPLPQQQHKVCVGFGRPETSDLTVMLYGKEGIAVRMSVHRDVLCQSSAFFAQRLAVAGPAPASPAPPACVEIHDCDDAEIYVETVGLMYCDDEARPHRRLLLKQQSVPRVLRIIKAADALGFHTCVRSCLDYLEAVPWVGDEEERSVVSSVRRLQSKDNDGCNGYGGVVGPLLKRIAASDDCLRPPSDTFASITEMVLTSTDERGRREMKALVLNLLKDSSRRSHVGVTGVASDGSPPDDISISSAETLYASCRGCLDRLRRLFADAASSSSSSEPEHYSPALTRRIGLETDNLLWLVEMLLAGQRAGDGLVALWSAQAELAASHARVPAPSRHAVSRVTARLFVGVGRGELLPPSDARLRLLQVWLPPLIDDYAWLQRGGIGGGGGSRPSAAFDRRLVEDGIGQTILTLPMEDQRSILLAWFGRFLKLGDDCPNLQRAFEVWWRRTFVRPYVLHQKDSDAGDVLRLDRSSS